MELGAGEMKAWGVVNRTIQGDIGSFQINSVIPCRSDVCFHLGNNEPLEFNVFTDEQLRERDERIARAAFKAVSEEEQITYGKVGKPGMSYRKYETVDDYLQSDEYKKLTEK